MRIRNIWMMMLLGSFFAVSTASATVILEYRNEDGYLRESSFYLGDLKDREKVKSIAAKLGTELLGRVVNIIVKDDEKMNSAGLGSLVNFIGHYVLSPKIDKITFVGENPWILLESDVSDSYRKVETLELSKVNLSKGVSERRGLKGLARRVLKKGPEGVNLDRLLSVFPAKQLVLVDCTNTPKAILSNKVGEVTSLTLRSDRRETFNFVDNVGEKFFGRFENLQKLEIRGFDTISIDNPLKKDYPNMRTLNFVETEFTTGSDLSKMTFRMPALKELGFFRVDNLGRLKISQKNKAGLERLVPSARLLGRIKEAAEKRIAKRQPTYSSSIEKLSVEGFGVDDTKFNLQGLKRTFNKLLGLKEIEIKSLKSADWPEELEEEALKDVTDLKLSGIGRGSMFHREAILSLDNLKRVVFEDFTFESRDFTQPRYKETYEGISSGSVEKFEFKGASFIKVASGDLVDFVKTNRVPKLKTLSFDACKDVWSILKELRLALEDGRLKKKGITLEDKENHVDGTKEKARQTLSAIREGAIAVAKIFGAEAAMKFLREVAEHPVSTGRAFVGYAVDRASRAASWIKKQFAAAEEEEAGPESVKRPEPAPKPEGVTEEEWAGLTPEEKKQHLRSREALEKLERPQAKKIRRAQEAEIEAQEWQDLPAAAPELEPAPEEIEPEVEEPEPVPEVDPLGGYGVEHEEYEAGIG